MNLAIIGTGMIAQFMLRAWNGLPGLRIYAICSRSMEKGNKVAARFGVSKVYDNYDTLLNEDAIDTVYIALPNHLHYSYAKKAILAGKNVIVEKPFTSNDWECADLIKHSKEQKVFLWEAIKTLHLPVYKLLKTLLPKIGAVHMAQLSYCRMSSRYEAFTRGEIADVFSLDCSGGSLMDINVYNVHMAVGLLGMPESYVYHTNKQHNGIDASGCAILRYPDAICSCTASKDTNGPMFTAIQGTSGSLYLDSIASHSDKVRLVLGNEESEYPVDTVTDSGVYQMNEFLRQNSEKDFAACWSLLEHSQNVMNLMTALRRSAGIVFPADKQ